MTVTDFRDKEGVTLSGLTRDGEMSLAVLPLTADGCLIDGQRIDAISERELAEALNLDTVPAPASWVKVLHDCRMETEGPLAGVRQLVVSEAAPGVWLSQDSLA